MSDNSKALGTDPVLTLLAKYCVPAVLAMLVQVLYTVVDSIFIGHFIGKDGLAAITLVFPLVVFSSGFGMLVGIGACSCISLLLGQRRLDEAEKTLGNAFSMIFLSSFIMTVTILILGTLFVNASTVSEPVRKMALTFLWISIFSGILPSLMFGLNNIIRVQGNPQIAMGTIIFGFVLNSILNPIFIAVFHWGVAGSALATTVAQTITVIWVLYFFRSSRSLLQLRWRNLPLDWKICGPVLAIGLAPFLAQSVNSLMGIILNVQLERFGAENALSVSGVIYRSAQIIFAVVLGIWQGAQPIVGYNYGAKQCDRVLKTWRLAILISSIWCFITTALILAFPLKTVEIFTKLTPEIREISVFAIRLSFLGCFMMGMQVCVSLYFQTIGKPKLSIFLSLSRQVIFMIPALLLLPMLCPMIGWPQLNGVWCAFAVSDTLSFFLVLCFFIRETGNLKAGRITGGLGTIQVESDSWPIEEGQP